VWSKRETLRQYRRGVRLLTRQPGLIGHAEEGDDVVVADEDDVLERVVQLAIAIDQALDLACQNVLGKRTGIVRIGLILGGPNAFVADANIHEPSVYFRPLHEDVQAVLQRRLLPRGACEAGQIGQDQRLEPAGSWLVCCTT
jgi:hypothetical protein